MTKKLYFGIQCLGTHTLWNIDVVDSRDIKSLNYRAQYLHVTQIVFK